jgi:hypothetical protein
VKGVPKERLSCQRDLRLARMRRRPKLCAASWPGTPCLRPTSWPLVKANWIATGRRSLKYKWRWTAYASSFETLSPGSSTGAPWPSTEKRCLTNGGNSTERRRDTPSTSHVAERFTRFAHVVPDRSPGRTGLAMPPSRHTGHRGQRQWLVAGRNQVGRFRGSGDRRWVRWWAVRAREAAERLVAIR